MPNGSSHEQSQKADEVTSSIDGMGKAMITLAKLMQQDPARRGEHVTELLDRPITGDLGTFSKKWKYTEGCDLANELLYGGVDAAVITVEDSSGEKVISIGRTPDAWSPSAGGHSLQAHDKDAGDPGDYVLESRSEGPNSVQKFRYLDEADLRDVLVRNGDPEVKLGPNAQRGRQIQISGQVNSVIGLLEK